MLFQSSGRYRNPCGYLTALAALLSATVFFNADLANCQAGAPVEVEAPFSNIVGFDWKTYDATSKKTPPQGSRDTEAYTTRVDFPTTCADKDQSFQVTTQRGVTGTNTLDVSVLIPCVLMPNEVLTNMNKDFDKTGSVILNRDEPKPQADFKNPKCQNAIACTAMGNPPNKAELKCDMKDVTVMSQRDNSFVTKEMTLKTNFTADDFKTNADFQISDLKFVMNVDPYCKYGYNSNGNAFSGLISHRYRRTTPPLTDATVINHAFKYGADTDWLPYSAITYDMRQNTKGVDTYIGASWKNFKPASDEKACGYNCDSATAVLYEQTDGINSEAAFSIYFTNECKWITICVEWKDNEQCDSPHTITIATKNGFVINTGNTRAIPMKFFRTPDQQWTVVHVERVRDGSKYRTVITNAFRQSTISGHINSDKYMIRVDSKTCLKTNLGIVFPGREGKVKEGDCPPVNGDKFSLLQNHKEDEGLADATTVINEDNSLATTIARTMPPQNMNDLDGGDTGSGPDSELPTSLVGWMTWATVAGLATGSVVTLGILSGVLYVGRRSFYGDWYRGMYKRYGTDASMMTGMTMNTSMNTTGAMTVGSTTSSNTSMMGTTGGGTTMGGTTAGDVVTQ